MVRFFINFEVKATWMCRRNECERNTHSQELRRSFRSKKPKMKLRLPKTERAAGKRGFRGGLTFRLECVKFAVCTGHPSGDAT